MKILIILWSLFVMACFINVHAQDKEGLVKETEQNGVVIYKDSLNNYFAEALMKITPNGFILPDGTNLIVFPKDLKQEEYEFITTFIAFRLANKKVFK